MTATSLMLLLATAAGAESPWLEVRSDGTCASRNLAEQIAGRIVGERNPSLAVVVELRSETLGAVAEVRISRGAQPLGEKSLRAPTCEEALAAATAIVALAVSQPRATVSEPLEALQLQSPKPRAELPAEASKPREELREAERLTATRSTPPRASASTSSIAVRTGRDTGNVAREPHDHELRLVGAAGVDVGTLPESTAVVGIGARVGAASGELRGFATYGLPTTREEVSTVTERTQADFLALSFDYCHGLDSKRWFGLCGGIEAGLQRASRLEQAAPERAREEERRQLTCGPLLSAAFAYRAARWAPELDVSMRLPLVGAAEPLRPAFRAAVGAALPF